MKTINGFLFGAGLAGAWHVLSPVWFWLCMGAAGAMIGMISVAMILLLRAHPDKLKENIKGKFKARAGQGIGPMGLTLFAPTGFVLSIPMWEWLIRVSA